MVVGVMQYLAGAIARIEQKVDSNDKNTAPSWRLSD